MISIIIPTHRGSGTIELAVKSALMQTVKEKEILVIDDNGLKTEEQIKTEEVLRSYISNNEIIYICHEKNRNGSSARNTGLEKAKGEYITFLDDDDYIFPDKLEKQIDTLISKRDNAMCICSGNYVDLNGVGYKKIIRSRDRLLYKYLMDRAYFNTTAIVFETNALRQIDGFDTSFRRHQDWEVVVRFLSQNRACILTNIEMTRYLEGRNSPISYQEAISNLQFFFDKTLKYMGLSMTKKEIEKIILHKKRLICQGLLRNGKIKAAYDYSCSYGNRFEICIVGLMIIPLSIRKVLFGSRKITKGKNELRNELNINCRNDLRTTHA